MNSQGPLIDLVNPTLNSLITKNFADQIAHNYWNTLMFASALPSEVVDKILETTPPLATADNDQPIWNLTSSGKFSLNSALDLLSINSIDINSSHIDWLKI